MLLEGHEGDIFSLQFHPEGQYLASSGFDRRVCKYCTIISHIINVIYSLLFFFLFLVLWSVYGECENISVMSGHTGAVMEMQFSPDGAQVYTASTDYTLGLWDVPTAQRIKKFKGHTTFVNCVQGNFVMSRLF